MAIVRALIHQPPSQVYDVLADGWSYSQWVVGTSHIRAVDADWPAVGSKIHHATGVWPLMIRDSTEVAVERRDQHLVLTARGRPFGQATIDLRLEPRDGGTYVTMREEIRGPVDWLVRNPPMDALVWRRNTEALARLSALAERRTTPAEDQRAGR